MKRTLLLTASSCLLIFTFTACGPAMLETQAPEVVLATPSPLPSNTPTLAATQTALPCSPTPLPTIVIPPTETLLPPLVLPTNLAVEPAFSFWDGLPSYLCGLPARLSFPRQV